MRCHCISGFLHQVTCATTACLDSLFAARLAARQHHSIIRVFYFGSPPHTGCTDQLDEKPIDCFLKYPCRNAGSQRLKPSSHLATTKHSAEQGTASSMRPVFARCPREQKTKVAGITNPQHYISVPTVGIESLALRQHRRGKRNAWHEGDQQSRSKIP